MRAKTLWRLGLLALVLALTPALAMAQFETGYAPSDPILPLPLGSTDPGGGGFYTGLEFDMLRQTVPLKSQVIMYRGFSDINAQTPTGASFVGSETPALNTNQVTGPGTYDPAFKLYAGWKFDDGSVLTVSWLYVFQNRFQAVATAAPNNLNVRSDFADSFITAPVYNFPVDFAGLPSQANGPINPATGLAVATYGPWDGATQATESFVQRTSSYDLIWRKPVWETENYRLSSLVGPRYFWIWETFGWRVTNFGFSGDASTSATYGNSTSNEMYGLLIGCSQEWYVGHGFACQLDLDVVPDIDFVHSVVEYRTGYIPSGTSPAGTENKRSRRDYTFALEGDAKFSLSWYPVEYVQFNFGYNFMSFINTVTSEMPVSFDYSALTPSYNHQYVRIIDGISASIIIVF